MFVLGDLNIDWNVKECPLKSRLLSLADTCNLSQVVKKPIRICKRADGVKSSTCIDLILHFKSIHVEDLTLLNTAQKHLYILQIFLTYVQKQFPFQ